MAESTSAGTSRSSGSIMDYTDIKGWIDVNKTLLDLYKSARDALPKSKQRDEIDEKIRAAEDIMRRSDAQFAKDLGYKLCQCEFPPRIMLWREQEKAYVCPNEACGRKIVPTAKRRIVRSSWLD
jgi:hypothetical protein